MSNEMVIRKALVAGINYDGALGEDYLFEGNMIPFGYGKVDITDAMLSRGIQYLIENLESDIELKAKQAKVKIEGSDSERKAFMEGLVMMICARYSMGEQNGIKTDREVAAQEARGYRAEDIEVIE